MRRPSSPAPRKARPGGRSARVVEEVLRRTIEVLGQVGYGALRVEDVASRSGVNKTTIYRRWPTKPDLVAAALGRLHLEPTVEDTGELERDLTASFARMTKTAGSSLVRGVTRMLQLERGDPELEALLRRKREAHAAPRRKRLEIAVARGELPKGTDVEMLLRTLTDAIYAQYLRSGEMMPLAHVRRVSALILAGARAGAAKRS